MADLRDAHTTKANQGRTTLWRSYNSRALKATIPRKWSKPPSRRSQSSKNMAPNFFGCPGSTPACGPESGSFPRATPVGSLWKGAGGSGKGRSIREAAGTYSYLCRIDGPQYGSRRRSLTTKTATTVSGDGFLLTAFCWRPLLALIAQLCCQHLGRHHPDYGGEQHHDALHTFGHCDFDRDVGGCSRRS